MPMAESPIRTLREEQNLSMEALARLAGVSGMTVYRIEKGRSQPSAATLRALAQALGVPMEALLVAHDSDGSAAAQIRREEPANGSETTPADPTLAGATGSASRKET